MKNTFLPKVSILIPTYNGEKYIKETIESCLTQTYSNIEIIVTDDCSTDSTVQILETYKDKIDLHINQENLGISKNVNLMGLSLTSDFMILLGHDDLLPPEHIELMIKEFIEPDIVIVHCNSTVINDKGEAFKTARNDSKQEKKTANPLFELSIDNFISSCGLMTRVSIFKQIGGWDESYKFYGEWLFYIKALDYGKIKYTRASKAMYRRHTTNITNTFKDKIVHKELSKYKNTCRRLAKEKGRFSFLENLKFYRNLLKRLV